MKLLRNLALAFGLATVSSVAVAAATPAHTHDCSCPACPMCPWCCH